MSENGILLTDYEKIVQKNLIDYDTFKRINRDAKNVKEKLPTQWKNDPKNIRNQKMEE